MNNHILLEDIKLFGSHFELSDQIRNKVFLITGATGLIGSIMIKCLQELNRQRDIGIRIIAVVRDMEKAKRIFDDCAAIEFLHLPLDGINESSVGKSIDYIVHLASPTASKYFVDHPVETLRTAIDGTAAVLEYAKTAKVKAMVFASSLEVYGTHESDEWISEDFQGYVNPTEVRSSYNIGKRGAECLCHAYAKEYFVPVRIARLTQTTGAGIAEDDNRVIAQFTRLAVEGKDIILHTTGESARQYCYTTDAVSALLFTLLKGESGEAYNIAAKDTYISARGIADLLKEQFFPNINVSFELKENMGYAPETKLRLNTAKIENLGWKPAYDLTNILDRLINYLC